MRPSVDPHETLYLSIKKRFVPAYVPGENGARELHLFCGLQEITFDEPELFPWAEKLIQQESFMAGAATGWSAEPLDWPRVRGLLETLIEEGIIDREPPEKSVSQVPLSQAHLDFVESEKSRPAPDAPRSWNPDPGAVLREIAGRDLEPGYIEAVVPVHRLAHIAVDREGRQVGEMNVFPEALRLKVPTEWRTCNYAGSRYRDEQPMNMTALKSMIAHWKPVLRATLLVREEFLRRYPQPEAGSFRLGDLHFLSTAILALPALQIMRWRDPVRNGDLDPVLSSLFRVTDGVRMVTNHMLDLPEWKLTHDHPTTPGEVTAAAERENQYLSIRGVCAGPQNMIDEFVATLMEGRPVQGEGPEPGAWTADIPLAVDYALRGLQVFAAVQLFRVRMGLAYSRIRETLGRAPGASSARLDRLRGAIDRDWELANSGRLNMAEQRAWSEQYYGTMFARAQVGIRGLLPEDRQDLETLLTPPPRLLADPAPLAEVLAAGEPAATAPVLREIAGHLLDYLRFERQGLTAVSALQRDIDTLLGRPHPKGPLTSSQVGIYHILRRGTAMPYLFDTVLEALDTAIDNHPGATTVVRQGRSLALH